MQSGKTRTDVSESRVRSAKRDTDLKTTFKIGGEQYHPDTGHYFRHHRLYVEGDMNDMEVLREVSRLCDEHGFEVDRRGSHTFAGDDYAILRVNWDEE